jgi:hypothetical protein
VVVDPPYEQADERARIAATLAAAHRKWAHGVTVMIDEEEARAVVDAGLIGVVQPMLDRQEFRDAEPAPSRRPGAGRTSRGDHGGLVERLKEKGGL